MSVRCFDPFADRLSRDIRNTLSSAFALAVEKKDDGALHSCAAELDTAKLEACYQDYVQQRFARYARVLAQLRTRDTDPFEQAVILWNEQLFFEVHEVLEHAWYDAVGETRQVMQAMIRAAGVYIKMEAGYAEQAGKIAARAIPVLAATSLLHRYFDVRLLVQALQHPERTPPLL